MTSPSEPRRIRLVVHALERTGPPMLALSFARWLDRTHPGVGVSFLAFRGGPLLEDIRGRWPIEVVLDPAEPWNAAAPSTTRMAELVSRLQWLPRVDANLLVSVAAGQVLPLLGSDCGPIVTWSVEIGNDLHWIDDAPVGLIDKTDRWLAGSRATAAELSRRAGLDEVEVVAEFVDPVGPAAPAAVADARREAGVAADEVLIVGAGIATYRKGIDLFLEAALAHRRSGGRARFAWVGGERDVLHPLIARELHAEELAHLVLLPSRSDLTPLLTAADVLVHPARFDAFPLVCIQAALAGTPVVAFGGVGGRDEMFGPTALGAPYPDLDGLVAAARSLEDPLRRRAVGEAQREWVGERFTADAAGPDLLGALGESVPGGSAPTA